MTRNNQESSSYSEDNFNSNKDERAEFVTTNDRVRTLLEAIISSDKKNLIKLIALGIIGLIGLIGAGWVAQTYANIGESEETLDIYNAAAEIAPELIEAVTWLPDSEELRREMEPDTRQDVTATWLRAWEQVSVISQNGDTSAAETYFSGSALEAVSVIDGDEFSNPVHQLSHELKINFYSRDGQIIGLTAPKVELLRGERIGSEQGWKISEESYDAVLILQDGNWRVQHWVRNSADQVWWTQTPAPALDEAQITSGVNYYPKQTPFGKFWANYDSETTAKDFDKISELGADSIRIFLPFFELGGANISASDLEDVNDLFDLASERNLGVVVTLFDGRTDHRTSVWNSDSRHLEVVVNELKNHPALIMWDLKNEADLDIDRYGVDEQLTYAWLNYISHELRELDSQTPTTVGWSSADAALAAPVNVDAVSFHHYQPAELLLEAAPKLKEHAGDRQILLTEYGLPTYDSIFPGGHTEKEQAAYVAETLRAVRDTEIDGAMVWTLWDLDEAPVGASKLPNKNGEQKTLGILRADGTEKPAASLINPESDIDSVESPGIIHRFTQKTFWRLVFAFMLFVPLAIYAKKRLIRRRYLHDS